MNKSEVVAIKQIKEVVGLQLSSARQYRGYSIRFAAKKLGISPAYLSQIENSQRNVSLEILFKASKVYKFSVDALLGKEPIPGKDNKGRKVPAFFAQFFQTQT